MAQPRRVVPDGAIKGVLNNTGTDIILGAVVSWDTTLEQVVLPASSAAAMAGVAMEVLTDADGKRYNIQKEGRAICIAGAAVSVGDLVMPQTTGRVITRTGTNSIVGTAKTAAAALGDEIEIDLNLQVGA